MKDGRISLVFNATEGAQAIAAALQTVGGLDVAPLQSYFPAKGAAKKDAA